ncbi:MAG: hypothetical protein M3154_07885 [Candidatus Eremiobacteraeota bacterium]|nr:hypothetical protein [Candidatus Eremiobacteraeota bacterium]
MGESYLGPPITLATADADDQHEYVLAPVPPADPASRYHVFHGAALDSALGARPALLA